MTVTFSWNDRQSATWLEAFSLPILPWTNSFLGLLGLPKALLEHLDSWEAIYTTGLTQHQAQVQATDWVSIQYEGRGELLKQTVTQMLQQLADQAGRSTAIQLEQWVQFYFLCKECEVTMRYWERALRLAFANPNSPPGRRRIEPPSVLTALLPDIFELVDFERRQMIYKSLEAVAPPPPYEQCEYEKMDKCYEFVLMSWTINRSLTHQALQILARELDESERQQVVDWAKAQLSRQAELSIR